MHPAVEEKTMAENGDIRAGIIDVHAHWLPRELLALPPGNPLGGMNDRDGELLLGDIPLSFPAAVMTDVDTVVADTLKAELGARVPGNGVRPRGWTDRGVSADCALPGLVPCAAGRSGGRTRPLA